MGDSLFERMANRHENRLENKATSVAREGRFPLIALLAVAIGFRFYALGAKPPHFDEGINGHFVLTIWRDGFYSYDPTNFHGPLYFYLCQLAELLLGRGIESFRMMNAVLAVAFVYGVFQFRRFVGSCAVTAAWILALSPAFIFYGRYAIHETLFVIGQAAFIYGRFTWMERPSRTGAAWIGLGLVILISTKETFFIFLGTWVIAELAIRFLERVEPAKRPWSDWPELTSIEKRDLIIDVIAISGITLLVLAALFTGFFEHPKGLSDFFRAFDFWSKTGTEGKGHEKPVTYWIELLMHYEWPLLMGLVLSAVAVMFLRTESRKQRLLLLMGFGHFLAYSLIPYKTPWLLLGFWPLAFFRLPTFSRGRARVVFFCTLLVAVTYSTYRAYEVVFLKPTDPSEPYVYVQTTDDYAAVMSVLQKKTARHPEARNSSIVVMIQDPWPLPFDLSLYPKMRYARLKDIDRDPTILQTADVLFIDGSIIEGLRHVFPKRFARMKFQLREAYEPGWALFAFDEFQFFLPPDVDIEEAAPANEDSQ